MNVCVICGTEFRNHAQLPHKFQRVLSDPNQDVLFEITSPPAVDPFTSVINATTKAFDEHIEGLLLAHFGTKETLKEFANDYVLEYDKTEITQHQDLDTITHKYEIRTKLRLRLKTLEEFAAEADQAL